MLTICPKTGVRKDCESLGSAAESCVKVSIEGFGQVRFLRSHFTSSQSYTNTQHAKDKRHQKQAKVVSENLLQLSLTMIHTDTKNFDALPAPRGDDEIRGRLLSKLGIYPGEVLPRQVLPAHATPPEVLAPQVNKKPQLEPKRPVPCPPKKDQRESDYAPSPPRTSLRKSISIRPVDL